MMSDLLPILVNDFSREPSELRMAQELACQKVIASDRWILSEFVKAFEGQWAQYCQAHHAIGVANGMDAIEISLRALGVGPGHEVITTSLTAFATTLAILRCGARPVFADIDISTGCLDPTSARTAITSATRAIVVVHLYGQAARLDELVNLCAVNSIDLIEDCAQAHGAMFNGKPVGTYGTLAAWSFYPTKNLGAIGDAGAITTSLSHLAEQASMLRNYGQRDRYNHTIQGLNSRLDELQASILIERLKYLPLWTTRRRAIAHRYWTEIHNPRIHLLSRPVNPSHHVHHLFVIRTPDRSLLQAHLAKCGVNTLIHYPVACHNQKALEPYRLTHMALPATIEFTESCLSLPVHPYLTEEEVSRVIQSCNSF